MRRLLPGLLVLIAAACAKSPTAEPPSAPPASPSAATPEAEIDASTRTQGAAAYAKGMCAKCHGDNGRGTERGPDLTDDRWAHGDGSVEMLARLLETGVPKESLADPSFPFGMNPATNLIPDPDERRALAAYVWSLSHP